jgi:hypothetical protein
MGILNAVLPTGDDKDLQQWCGTNPNYSGFVLFTDEVQLKGDGIH